MSRDWEPDVELDLETAHGIVSNQFPRFRDLVPRFLGRGWDNICLLYPDGTVFRLPTRQMGGDLVRREVMVLPYLEGHLSLPIPTIEWRGHSTDSYPYDFMGYPLLPGCTADALPWTAQRRMIAAAKLGEFLKRIHGISISGTVLEGLPFDQGQKTDPQALLRKIEVRIASIVRLVPEMAAKIDAIRGDLGELAHGAGRASSTVLVHGDLYARHLIVDSEGEIAGVIDWGDVHLGDPLGDLSIAFSFLDEEERGGFWQAYGCCPKVEDQRRAALRAAMYGFALYSYGLEENDAAAREMGAIILDRVKAF